MLAQVIKQSSNHCSEEGPEFMGIGGKRFILKKWGQDARLELGEVPVSTLVHCRIETELIAKVLKEQAFVIARRFRDGIDARTVDPCSAKTSSAAFRMASRALSASWGRPRLLPGSSMLTHLPFLTGWLHNYLVRL